MIESDYRRLSGSGIYKTVAPFSECKNYAMKILIISSIIFGISLLSFWIGSYFEEVHDFINNHGWLMCSVGTLLYIFEILYIVLDKSAAKEYPKNITNLVGYTIGLTILEFFFGIHFFYPTFGYFFMVFSCYICLSFVVWKGENKKSTKKLMVIAFFISCAINFFVFQFFPEWPLLENIIFLVLVLGSNASILTRLFQIFQGRQLISDNYVRDVMLLYLGIFIFNIEYNFS